MDQAESIKAVPFIAGLVEKILFSQRIWKIVKSARGEGKSLEGIFIGPASLTASHVPATFFPGRCLGVAVDRTGFLAAFWRGVSSIRSKAFCSRLRGPHPGVVGVAGIDLGLASVVEGLPIFGA